MIKLNNAVQVSNELNLRITDHISSSVEAFQTAQNVDFIKEINEKGKRIKEKGIQDNYKIVNSVFDEDKYGELGEGNNACFEKIERKKKKRKMISNK